MLSSCIFVDFANPVSTGYSSHRFSVDTRNPIGSSLIPTNEGYAIVPSSAVFVDRVFQIAKEHGYPVERNRQGLRQIDFGHKKLHEEHIRRLYPDILQPTESVSNIIDVIAPGRPCTHRPMREIVAQYRKGATTPSSV
jgi:hypothetical protein